jgi:hypothetical protein
LLSELVIAQRGKNRSGVRVGQGEEKREPRARGLDGRNRKLGEGVGDERREQGKGCRMGAEEKLSERLDILWQVLCLEKEQGGREGGGDEDVLSSSFWREGTRL